MLLHLGKHRLGQKDHPDEEAQKKNALVQVLLDEIMEMRKQRGEKGKIQGEEEAND